MGSDHTTESAKPLAGKAPSACSPADHLGDPRFRLPVPEPAVEAAARLFRALGDAARLRLVARLALGPACVSEISLAENESITTVSQRLRILRADNIVRRRRQGKHMVYSLTDQHMLDLVFNGLAHASEGTAHPSIRFSNPDQESPMAQHSIHDNHPHQHGANCGHTAVQHDDHTDYLHDGHLHHFHDGHIDEHTFAVNASNPADCTGGHDCDGHEAGHVHGPSCGHPAVPHGDHVDYLVAGHLHHQEQGHCDNHGDVALA